MAKGPKGEKRPADANQRAVMVARIAIGEIEDIPAESKAAAALGKRGGNARAAKLSAVQRSEIARVAAAARWKKSGL